MEIALITHIVPKKNAVHSAITKKGQRYHYKSYAARISEDTIRKEIWAQWKVHNKEPWKTSVAVKVLLRKTRADAIGLLETILDAMEGIVYHNDRQVVKGSYEWSDALASPTTAVICVEKI